MNSIAWPRALPVVLLAGFFMAIGSLLPYAGVLCCLWALGAGAASVGLYRWRVEQSVTTGMGAKLGAAAGLAGFMIYALGFVGRLLIQGRQFREAIRKGLQDAAARNPDPKAAEMVQWFASPEGMAVLLTLILMVFLFAFLTFSTIGGAIGAALFGQKDRKDAGS
ncbi:MAG: hypothetical protein ACRESV_05485 [Nevskiales bacterium]